MHVLQFLHGITLPVALLLLLNQTPFPFDWTFRHFFLLASKWGLLVLTDWRKQSGWFFVFSLHLHRLTVFQGFLQDGTKGDVSFYLAPGGHQNATKNVNIAKAIKSILSVEMSIVLDGCKKCRKAGRQAAEWHKKALLSFHWMSRFPLKPSSRKEDMATLFCLRL